MTLDGAFEDLWKEIRVHHVEGNINALIQLAIQNYALLKPLGQECNAVFQHWFKQTGIYLSPETLRQIESLPEEVRCNFFDNIPFKSYRPSVPTDAVGRIRFAAATSTTGMSRELRFEKAGSSELSPGRLQVLDRVGAPVFSRLRQLSGRMLTWKPYSYFYSIVDPCGQEDPAVHGNSLSLPLALALFSYITATPLPRDLSATGNVDRNGRVLPVAHIGKKLSALKTEQHFIDRVLIANEQELSEIIPGLEPIRVATVAEAVALVFPGIRKPDVTAAPLKLEDEIQAFRKQYGGYLYDTCLENAQQIIHYLESGGHDIPRSKSAGARFVCYWRKGCCHCHKGQVGRALKAMKTAQRIYENNRDWISESDYFQSQNNYAVALKDVFLYEEAESIHQMVNEKTETSAKTAYGKTAAEICYEKGKNLSSYSQLCLAQHRYAEAEKFQQEAISLIDLDRPNELPRNYGLLAWVYIRKKDFKKAKAALKKAETLLNKNHIENRSYYHWAVAEYLYGKALSLKRRNPKIIQELHYLADVNYPDITDYTIALIHKFSGLAYLLEQKEEVGMSRLESVICYLEDQSNPVASIIAATVRIERALYRIKHFDFEKIIEDIRCVKTSLGLRKDIAEHFRDEKIALTRFLRFKKTPQAAIDSVVAALHSINRKIPF